MREVVIRELCDQCHAEGGSVEAVDSIRWSDGSIARRFDHCAEHDNPRWTELLALSVEDVEATAPGNGQAKQRRTRKVEEPSVCAICGYVSRSGGGLAAHVGAKHPDHVGEYRANRNPLTCPECGRDFPKGATSLGVHRRRIHGVMGAQHRKAANG